MPKVSTPQNRSVREFEEWLRDHVGIPEAEVVATAISVLRLSQSGYYQIRRSVSPPSGPIEQVMDCLYFMPRRASRLFINNCRIGKTQ